MALGFMSEHRYTVGEREAQLGELIAVLPPLIEHVHASEKLSSLAPKYQSALAMARGLLAAGFSQEQLSELGRSVPDAFHRHKEWRPPLVQQSDGSWAEPNWFAELEAVLQPALRAAGVLRIVGYY
jgi:hypothetical protein